MMLMEGGLVPFVGLLWRLDAAWRGCRTEVPFCVRPPSEYVHDHVAWTTQPLEEPPDDRLLAPAIQGLDPARTLCFSSDYPHWDFDDPRQTLQRLPAEWRDARRPRERPALLRSPGTRRRRELGADLSPARRRARARGGPAGRDRWAQRRPVPSRRRPSRPCRPMPASRRAPRVLRPSSTRHHTHRRRPDARTRPALVRCPWHKWDFDIATGRCLVHPRIRVRRYDVMVQDQTITISLQHPRTRDEQP